MSVAVQTGTRNQRHCGTQVYGVVIRVNTLRTWDKLVPRSGCLGWLSGWKSKYLTTAVAGDHASWAAALEQGWKWILQFMGALEGRG